MVILLPIVVLTGFVSKFLLDDYREYQSIQEAASITSISDEIENIVSKLKEEENFSLLKLQKKDDAFAGRLQKARSETNEALQAYNRNYTEIRMTSQNQRLADIGSSFQSLEKIRSRVDTNTITSAELRDSFGTLSNTLFEGLESTANTVKDGVISRTLYASIALSKEQALESDEKLLVYLMFLNGKATAENLREFWTTRFQQEGYHDIFKVLATPAQYAEYQKGMNDSSITEHDRFSKEIEALKDGGKIKQDPQRWWEVQSRKIEIMAHENQKILDNNITYAKGIAGQYGYFLLFTVSIFACTIVAMLVLVVICFRSLVSKLQEEIDILSRSGNDIMESITETSAGTSETASAVAETTTTVEELRQTAEVAADKASNVSNLSNNALKILRDSEESLELTIKGMSNIYQGMETISQSIIKLSEHSQTIGEIIDTVNDLAEQSHLLAVNAAIEAAKAGDQGKGFAVVAQEVRNLAEQSKQATVQVRNILNDIQNSTSAAVMATEQGTKAVSAGMGQSEKTNESIKQICEGIEEVVEAAAQIAQSSKQQLIGVEQVTIAMGNITEATGQQVEHMKNIELGIHGLNDVGQSLKTLSKEYTLVN
jgi:methyl-accepting chemotaxis protein